MGGIQPCQNPSGFLPHGVCVMGISPSHEQPGMARVTKQSVAFHINSAVFSYKDNGPKSESSAHYYHVGVSTNQCNVIVFVEAEDFCTEPSAA